MMSLVAVEVPYWGQSLLRVLGGIAAVLLPAGTIVYVFLFKMMSFMQSRLGPMEAGPHGITVNSISPGFIDTGGIPQEEIARWLQSIPAGYAGSPEDAVGAVLFLLSEEARYVNGANIQVSGAWGV